MLISLFLLKWVLFVKLGMSEDSPNGSYKLCSEVAGLDLFDVQSRFPSQAQPPPPTADKELCLKPL